MSPASPEVTKVSRIPEDVESEEYTGETFHEESDEFLPPENPGETRKKSGESEGSWTSNTPTSQPDGANPPPPPPGRQSDPAPPERQSGAKAPSPRSSGSVAASMRQSIVQRTSSMSAEQIEAETFKPSRQEGRGGEEYEEEIAGRKEAPQQVLGVESV